MNLLSDYDLVECLKRWQAQNPEPKPELNSVNDFTFLVAVVLSAQATDKSVNLATEKLFTLANSPQKILELGQEKLIEFIRPVGLYKNKAQNIMKLCQKLINEFDSKVPETREELMSLPGVGRKTANVVLNVIFKQPTMPVDTHILRICPKIGIAAGTTPEQVEKSLLERIPPEFSLHAHHWLLLHGRYVCTARSPHCDNCIIKDLCLEYKSNH